MSAAADGSWERRTEKWPLDVVIGVTEVTGVFDKHVGWSVKGVTPRSKRAQEHVRGETWEYGHSPGVCFRKVVQRKRVMIGEGNRA